MIDRRRPGKGYRHFLPQRDIETFIGLLPDWTELSKGLNAIVLAPGHRQYFGYHSPGIVHICAWRDDLGLRYRENEVGLEKNLPITGVRPSRVSLMKRGAYVADLTRPR